MRVEISLGLLFPCALKGLPSGRQVRLDSTRLDSTRLDSTRLDSTRFRLYFSVPSAGVCITVSQWQFFFYHGYKWKHSAYITCPELQCYVNSVQWRPRSLTNHRRRVLHLVDSVVVANVLAKGETF